MADINIGELVAFHLEHGKIAHGDRRHARRAASARSRSATSTVTEFNEKPRRRRRPHQRRLLRASSATSRRRRQYGDVMLEREPMDELVERGELAGLPPPGFWEPMDTLREFRLLNRLWENGERQMEDAGDAPRARQLMPASECCVTGHTGFKGSWLSLWLDALGAEVIGFCARCPDRARVISTALARHRRPAGRHSRSRGADTVQSRAKPDIVFHLAAQSLVRKAYAAPARDLSRRTCWARSHCWRRREAPASGTRFGDYAIKSIAIDEMGTRLSRRR